MTILAALNGYYHRMADRGDVPPYGYSNEKIAIALVISETGAVVNVLDFRSGKTSPTRPVPQSSKRSGSIPRPFFLWDNSKHIWGLTLDKVTKKPVETPVHLEAFRKYHHEVIGDTDDVGLKAVLNFIDGWTVDQFSEPMFQAAMMDVNCAFILDGDADDAGNPRFVHDRPVARLVWENIVADRQGEHGLCLVTGREGPIARLHPAIKGVMGAQPTGASIASYNSQAFCSYGAEQGRNSPVSEVAAFGYGTALNALLTRHSGHNMLIGDTTTVFWCDAGGVGEASAAGAEDLFGDLAACIEPKKVDDGTEAAKVRDDLSKLAKGEPLGKVRPDIDPQTKFNILGLSPNVSRLSVRYWHRDTFGEVLDHVTQHWRDLDIEPKPMRSGDALIPLWMLLNETAVQKKSDNVSPLLGGDLMRSILTGSRYPKTLLTSILTRVRADGEVNGIRAAICKAVLVRDHREDYEKEAVPLSLDINEPNPAYRLGRLFAVLERAQRQALGAKVNATIKDKFFSSASATPAGVFPVLIRGAQNHLSKIRKDGSANLADGIDKDIGQILESFGSGLPKTLRIEDQGRFLVGYYHQRNAGMTRNGNGNGNGSASPPTESTDKTAATTETEI